MQYGLIGEKLGHSFSARIHAELGYEYSLLELNREALAAFLTKREFRAINVTIPYKQAVIPFLDAVDESAAKIGAVNTVIHRGGKLYGYNTDYAGLKALIAKTGVSLSGKTVLILGTGGTSLTARQVALDLGAQTVVRVSRSAKEDAVSYAKAYTDYADCACIINTTPVGMYPRVEEVPIHLERFSALEAVFDAVYNPLSTRLVQHARQRGILAEGGLYMLVAQAVFASELFLDTHYPPQTLDTLYKRLLLEKQGIALIGMPGSGKSTVGKLLADALGKPFTDTDALIVQREGMEITDIFALHGEAYFRSVESEVIARVCAGGGSVIATGGGAVLNPENVAALKSNAKVYFLDRDIRDLVPTADRPLARDVHALEQRFAERYDIYKQSAQVTIKVSGDAQSVAEAIRKDFTGES